MGGHSKYKTLGKDSPQKETLQTEINNKKQFFRASKIYSRKAPDFNQGHHRAQDLRGSVSQTYLDDP